MDISPVNTRLQFGKVVKVPENTRFFPRYTFMVDGQKYKVTGKDFFKYLAATPLGLLDLPGVLNKGYTRLDAYCRKNLIPQAVEK